MRHVYVCMLYINTYYVILHAVKEYKLYTLFFMYYKYTLIVLNDFTAANAYRTFPSLIIKKKNKSKNSWWKLLKKHTVNKIMLQKKQAMLCPLGQY